MTFALREESKDNYHPLDTPQQNGIAKRRNRSIMDCARTLMIEKNVTIKYWKKEIITVVHTLNRVQLKKDSSQTPYELW